MERNLLWYSYLGYFILIFVPLILNSILCDLLYFLESIPVASYADDTTYSANKTNYLVIKEIEHFSEVHFKWIDFNYTKIVEKSYTILRQWQRKC